MTHRRVESAERRPDVNITAPAIAPLVMAGVGTAEARAFLLGSGAMGILLGLILWWKHR